MALCVHYANKHACTCLLLSKHNFECKLQLWGVALGYYGDRQQIICNPQTEQYLPFEMMLFCLGSMDSKCALGHIPVNIMNHITVTGGTSLTHAWLNSWLLSVTTYSWEVEDDIINFHGLLPVPGAPNVVRSQYCCPGHVHQELLPLLLLTGTEILDHFKSSEIEKSTTSNL